MASSWPEKLARRSARRQRVHDSKRLVEVGAVGLEVALEEQLSEPGLGIARDVLPDLVERAEERTAVLALRRLLHQVSAATDDVKGAGIPARRLRGGLDLVDEGHHLGHGHVAAVEPIAEGDGALDDGRAVAADGDGRMRLLNRLRLDPGPG